MCDFTLQCDISTKQTDVFLSIFLLLSKIAFRVLPRDQNFFYITFFVVNATVVLFLCFASCVFFLSRCFWIFKFPIRSQKLICLMCVWLVFVPLKLLRLFTEKKKKQSALIFRSAELPWFDTWRCADSDSFSFTRKCQTSEILPESRVFFW